MLIALTIDDAEFFKTSVDHLLCDHRQLCERRSGLADLHRLLLCLQNEVVD
jgi:hypothetical protein